VIQFPLSDVPATLQTDTTCDDKNEQDEHEHASLSENTAYDPFFDLTHENVLEKLLHPMKKAEFMEKHWARHPLVIASPPGTRARFEGLRRALFDLNVEEMMNASPSEQYFVWIRSKVDDKCDSFPVDEVASALSCMRGGCSLYFRAPQFLADQLCKGVSGDLGMNFAARFSNGDTRAEIETFVASAGHETGWHFDFQENFTIQLKGSKTWYFVDSGIQHPVRGHTPHYNESARTLETQLKVHSLQTPGFSFDPKMQSERERAVTLRAGDVLYHPAGIYHRVVCEEDSISINLSLVATTWADLVSSSVRQLMWTQSKWRAPFTADSFESAHGTLQNILGEVCQTIQSLDPQEILPNSWFLPRQFVRPLLVDLSDEQLSSLPLVVRRNPLGVLVRGSIDEALNAANSMQEDDDELDFDDEDDDDDDENDEGDDLVDQDEATVQDQDEDQAKGKSDVSMLLGDDQQAEDGDGDDHDHHTEGGSTAEDDLCFVFHHSFGDTNDNLESGVRVLLHAPARYAPLLERLYALPLGTEVSIDPLDHLATEAYSVSEVRSVLCTLLDVGYLSPVLIAPL